MQSSLRSNIPQTALIATMDTYDFNPFFADVGVSFTIGNDEESGGVRFGNATSRALDFNYITGTRNCETHTFSCMKTEVFAVATVVSNILKNKTENHFSLYPRSRINLCTRLQITMQCLVNWGESLQ
jgi:hypothetical protein